MARQSVEAFALRVVPRLPPGTDLLVRVAANARVPGRLSYANAGAMGLILAYLGLLLVFGARA